jgi:hypothetical protein
VYIYNPTCELAIANSQVSFMPNKHLRDFEKSLDILMTVFATDDDIVLVNEKPKANFLGKYKSIGFPSPKYLRMNELLEKLEAKDLHIEDIRPWGWSPNIHHVFKDIKSYCCSDFKNSPNYNWREEYKNLYSRKFALDILSSVIEKNREIYLSKSKMAKIFYNVDDIVNEFNKYDAVVLKSPWSSSGRGVQFLRKKTLHDNNLQWIRSVLKSQGYIMFEPLLEKKVDFSVQLFINENSKVEHVGYGYFKTNENGMYDSNMINHSIPNVDVKNLEILAKDLTELIERSELAKNYRGYLGVDCMLFREGDEIKIHPCLEINLRYNMGTLAIKLEQYICSESKAKFRVYFDPKKSFRIFHEEMLVQNELIVHNNLIKSGYVAMSNPDYDLNFGAYLIVEA